MNPGLSPSPEVLGWAPNGVSEHDALLSYVLEEFCDEVMFWIKSFETGGWLDWAVLRPGFLLGTTLYHIMYHSFKPFSHAPVFPERAFGRESSRRWFLSCFAQLSKTFREREWSPGASCVF